MQSLRLKLFLTGNTLRSQRALANLDALCRNEWADWRVELTVVDVLTQPEEADEARILATPTLVREAPLPVRRIVGDLSDTEQVLLGLGLQASEKGSGLHLWKQARSEAHSMHQVG